jgi:hypothetical protein
VVQKHFVIYIITGIMLVISIIYFYLTYQDYTQLLQPSSSPSDIIQTRNEMAFFLIVAIAYIPVAIWILKAKYGNKIPYTLALIGSGALIIFYILTRTTDIPSIGLQTDVGTIDIVTKVLQGVVIFLSVYIMESAKKAIYSR